MHSLVAAMLTVGSPLARGSRIVPPRPAVHTWCLTLHRAGRSSVAEGGAPEQSSVWAMLRLLRHQGMRPSAAGEQQPRLAPRLYRESGLGAGHVQGGPYNAPADGLYHPAVPIWTAVQPGDLIGTVYDLLGETVFECRAAKAGTVIVQVHLRHVTKGYFLAVVI